MSHYIDAGFAIIGGLLCVIAGVLMMVEGLPWVLTGLVFIFPLGFTFLASGVRSIGEGMAAK